jgi:hypothetical protein
MKINKEIKKENESESPRYQFNLAKLKMND